MVGQKFENWFECERCGGKGFISQTERCPDCGGYGDPEQKRLQDERIEAEKERERQELIEAALLEKQLEPLRRLQKQKAEEHENWHNKITENSSWPVCCDTAREYRNIVQLKNMPHGVEPGDGWYLVYDCWTGYDRIYFCPFCGAKLDE